MNVLIRHKQDLGCENTSTRGRVIFALVCSIGASYAQTSITQVQDGTVNSAENEQRAVQTELSQAIDQEQPVIAAAVESFVKTITANKEEKNQTEAVAPENVVISSDQQKERTLSTTIFVYTGDELGNPFVATGALASELGILNTTQSKDQRGSKSIEVSSVIVNRDIEETEVIVNNPRLLEPLEYFAKEALTYTGRITNRYGKPIALINGPDGLLYKAGVGDRLGRSQAQVARIEDTAVVIKIGAIEDVIQISQALQN